MHNYSTNSQFPRNVSFGIAGFSILLGWLLHFILVNLNVEASLHNYGIELWWFDVPSPFTFFAMISSIFDKWLWRIKWVQTDIPNLQGTWTGFIVSNRDKRMHTPVVIYIRQTLSKILVRLETETSFSVSTMAALNTEESAESGLKYEYRNEPITIKDEQMHPHRGTVHFHISTGSKEMQGYYFTNGQRGFYGDLVGFKLLDRRRIKYQHAVATLPSDKRVQKIFEEDHGENIEPLR